MKTTSSKRALGEPGELEPLPRIARQIARSVRAHREARGLSVSALARQAGLSKTILGQIENGEANPSLETLWRVANALDITLGSLLGEAQPPRTRLVRAGEGELLTSETGMVSRLILAEGQAHRSEVLEMRLAPSMEYRSKPHAPGTEELVLCLAGALEVGPEGEEQQLNAGDALWFPADVAHRYCAAGGSGEPDGPDECRALCFISYLPAATGV